MSWTFVHKVRSILIQVGILIIAFYFDFVAKIGAIVGFYKVCTAIATSFY